MSLAKSPRPQRPSSAQRKTFVTNSDSEKLERRNRQLERASEREEEREDGRADGQAAAACESARDRRSADEECTRARVRDCTLYRMGEEKSRHAAAAGGGVAVQLREIGALPARPGAAGSQAAWEGRRLARGQGAFNSWAEGKLPVDRQPVAPFPPSAQSALALGLR